MTITTQQVQRILAEKGYRSLSKWANKKGFKPNAVLLAFYEWERDYSQRVCLAPYGKRYEILVALDKDLRQKNQIDKPVLQFLIQQELGAIDHAQH
ncbi:hypothetical protein [Candidatus Albibeggiatoa sp. nov. BB20]|uniref:hypothetical protein n=1 Tax=Candidatus Albibeggiatoa sp. nov. BB20 TaxID=3162723 RepID=UPI003365753C